MGPKSNRVLLYVTLALPIAGLVASCFYIGISRYRSHRFARICVTGNENLIQDSGYKICNFPSPAGSNWYCDPRQLPAPESESKADRCELIPDGRRLQVKFQPGS